MNSFSCEKQSKSGQSPMGGQASSRAIVKTRVKILSSNLHPGSRGRSPSHQSDPATLGSRDC
jgi:hypothetical protein